MKINFEKILNKSLLISLILLVAIILGVSVRGVAGNPTAKDLNTATWKENGPFELSPERGRFSLLYSVVESKSLVFSNDLGKFAEPDVAVNKGKYVSLFAPLLSFVAVPGYIVGKFFGASQFGAFATVALFALFNFILIRLIAIRLGANPMAGTIAALVFLFGTPAFAYGVNLYQHHISTFLILLSLYVLLKSNRPWVLAVVFLLCASAIPLDYPNLFFMFPIGVFALNRIFSIKKIRNKLSAQINIPKALTLIVMIIPILFFAWFNQVSYGNPLQLSGTLQSVKDIGNIKDFPSIDAAKKLKEQASHKTPIALFRTRNMVNGFYIPFVSPDRGIIYYAPVVLFGIIGFYLALKKKVRMVSLLAAVIGANILLYSMWGDPWGGWAFGSRYLIPSYALLSIFVALLLTYWRKKALFLVPFIFIAFYSIAVNTLGAITTSAMPPKVEVLELEKLSGLVQKYTYERNWDLLLSGNSKSFVYQTFLKDYLTPLDFYRILVISIFCVVGVILIYFVATSNKKGEPSDVKTLEGKENV